ncbi:MAG: hypothetical protein QXW10_00180 [Candidatus Micrarchaeaceae archaeon]
MKNVNCSDLVKLSIPAIRYALAHVLKDRYQMEQSQIATSLGITQAAVNKYLLGRCSANTSKLGAAILPYLQSTIIAAAASSDTEKLNKLIDSKASGKCMAKQIKKTLGIEVSALA